MSPDLFFDSPIYLQLSWSYEVVGNPLKESLSFEKKDKIEYHDDAKLKIKIIAIPLLDLSWSNAH